MIVGDLVVVPRMDHIFFFQILYCGNTVTVAHKQFVYGKLIID